MKWDFKKLNLETVEDFLGWLSSFGAQFKVTHVEFKDLEDGGALMSIDFEEGITTDVVKGVWK